MEGLLLAAFLLFHGLGCDQLSIGVGFNSQTARVEHATLPRRNAACRAGDGERLFCGQFRDFHRDTVGHHANAKLSLLEHHNQEGSQVRGMLRSP